MSGRLLGLTRISGYTGAAPNAVVNSIPREILLASESSTPQAVATFPLLSRERMEQEYGLSWDN